MIARLLLLIVAGLPLWGLLSTSRQLDESVILTNEVLVSYPEQVTFRLETDPNVNIVDATLTYNVEQVSCLDVSTQVPVEVTGSTLEWDWIMIRSGNPPPGSTLWWEWTLTDDQGRTYTTPRQELTFEDDRFDWQTISNGDITLYWYAGEEVGPMLLEAAVDSLQVLEEDLGIELQEEVKFFIYGSPEDMRDAVLYVQDWAGGVAFSEYNVILMGVPPSIAADWGRSTVRHELTHLVLGQYGRSCVGGDRPSWLEEGLAMYAEGEPTQDMLDNLDDALRNNSFIPLRSLNGAFPAHSDSANLAYNESFSVVQFLSEEYGPQSISNLILALATGESYDVALEQVYGFNVDGLEQAWRSRIGAPQRVIPPTSTPISSAAVPTMAPLAGPQDYPTPESFPEISESQPGGSLTSGLCAFGLIPIMLLGAFSWQIRKSKTDE
ncbi:MAG: peptidase MA family metallohydrolase [Candidatus Promineifilaceae bacterium]|jgi:hypothetical protein